MFKNAHLLSEFGIVVPVAVDVGRVPNLLRPVYRLVRRSGQHEQFVPFVGQKSRVHLRNRSPVSIRLCTTTSVVAEGISTGTTVGQSLWLSYRSET